jgi:hypothetical protein
MPFYATRRVAAMPFYATRRVAALPLYANLAHGQHYVIKVDLRRGRDFGLGGGGLSKSRRQRIAQPEGNADHPHEGQTHYDIPDSHESTRCGICFHARTLAIYAAGVLIDKNDRSIEESDARQ